jgi:outer membrane protein, adhesin transport system
MLPSSRRTVIRPRWALSLLFLASVAGAQVDPALREAAQKAIDSQPDVAARLNALRASGDGITVARSGWLPKVAVEAAAGRIEDRITTRNPEGDTLDRTGVALTVTQMLWDGQATTRDVGRARREAALRWHEWTDATEQTALDALRAHHDVQRFRRLLALAEDNYVQHRYAYGQLLARFQAGVGRGVDLEQAGARLALAESNLTTETSNLHDVTARYLRIVGSAPPAGSNPATLGSAGQPATASEAVALAVRDSAAVSAAIESYLATRESASTREAAFQPRVEARLRSGTGRNFDGVPDQKRDTAVEVVLNWNLYNGGADQARVRQGAHLIAQAADQRDRVCRDVRQIAAIAYNDVRKLTEQQATLERNTLAIEKARDAYRQQFDIGQRSLLDLLNAENELYTARRASANAGFDLAIAQARSLAAGQQLVRRLGLKLPEIDRPEDGSRAAEDLPQRCPPEALLPAGATRQELDARATRLIQTAPPLPRQ